MNIGQNLLDAFDIVLEKRLTDKFANATHLIVAEISGTDLFTNTYTIQYQGATQSDVISNNNEVYSLGDIVEVITNGSEYAIVGLVSSTGAQARYETWLAQLRVDGSCAPSKNWNSLYFYHSVFNTYCGIKEADVKAFNSALLSANQYTLSAALTLTAPAGLHEYFSTVSVVADFKSVIYEINSKGESEEIIEDTFQKSLHFVAQEGNSQLTQTETFNLPNSSGQWVLDKLWLICPTTKLQVELKDITLNAEGDEETLVNKVYMEIETNEGTVFEKDGATELTCRAVLKNKSGGYFGSPSVRFIWGAADPTIIEADIDRYNALLGEGWAQLSEGLISSTFNVSINDVPRWKTENIEGADIISTRDIKCVAVLFDKNEPVEIANAIVTFENGAVDANVVLDLKSPTADDYTDTAVNVKTELGGVASTEEVTYHWIQQTPLGASKKLKGESDSSSDLVVSIEDIKLFNVLVCSVYQGNRYLGTDSIYIYESVELIGEQEQTEAKEWALVKNVSADKFSAFARYLQSIEWYPTIDETFNKSYNGADNRTRQWEVTYEEGNELPVVPYGYYLWQKTYFKTIYGALGFSYEVLTPTTTWIRARAGESVDYYQWSADAPDPIQITTTISDDGHGVVTSTIELGDWKEYLTRGSMSASKKWKCALSKYNDGSANVTEAVVVDVFTNPSDVAQDDSFILTRVEWQSRTSSIGGEEVWCDGISTPYVRAKLSYKSSLNDAWGVSPSVQVCNEKYAIYIGSNYITIQYAWSNSRETTPQSWGNLDLTEAAQQAYLWAYIKVYDNTPSQATEVLGEQRFVIATTLATDRDFQKVQKLYIASNVASIDGLPTNANAWTTEFDKVAAQISTGSGLSLWTKMEHIYSTFYWEKKSGEDRLYTGCTRENADSAVLNWAVEGNQTYIEGSKIYTGSINADALNIANLNAVVANIGGWKINKSSLSKTEGKNSVLLSTRDGGEVAASNQRIAVGGEVKEDSIEYCETLTNIPVESTAIRKGIFMFSLPKRGETEAPGIAAVLSDPSFVITVSYGGSGIEEHSIDVTFDTVEIMHNDSQDSSSRWGYKGIITLGEPYGVATIVSIQSGDIKYTVNEVTSLDDPAFAVYADGSVKATKGQIGGWMLGCVDTTSNIVGLYSTNLEKPRMGMAENNKWDGPIFWAGYEGQYATNPYEHEDEKEGAGWKEHTAFYITAQGSVGIRSQMEIGPYGSIRQVGSSNVWASDGIRIAHGILGRDWSVQSLPYAMLSAPIRVYDPFGWKNDQSKKVAIGQVGLLWNASGSEFPFGETCITWQSLFDCVKTPIKNSESKDFERLLSLGDSELPTDEERYYLNDGDVMIGGWKPQGKHLITYSGIKDSANNSWIHYYLTQECLQSYNTRGEYGVTNKAYWETIINNNNTSTSDIRKKKDIEILNERYNTFFDLLQPKRYKYIDGNSNRYHTGFIAQEVVSSLEESGLTTQELAAVLLEPEGGEQVWHLRRDEFVALNTWQIQKLKTRVSDLEARVTALENIIQKS